MTQLDLPSAALDAFRTSVGRGVAFLGALVGGWAVVSPELVSLLRQFAPWTLQTGCWPIVAFVPLLVYVIRVESNALAVLGLFLVFLCAALFGLSIVEVMSNA